MALTELDGTVCPSGCAVTVTITDNDEPDGTMQTVGGATWTLTGERTPAPGDTYTYSITLASGAKPNNEYVGFYLPDSATNQDLLGNDHTDCAAPKQFCATFTGATGNTSVWDGTAGHDTISYLLGDTSPHTATATLAIDRRDAAGHGHHLRPDRKQWHPAKRRPHDHRDRARRRRAERGPGDRHDLAGGGGGERDRGGDAGGDRRR